MSIRRYKDRTGLIAQTSLRSLRARHYVQVYLWATREALHANTESSDRCIGCFLPAPWSVYVTTEDDESGEVPAGTPLEELPRHIGPKIGELHFLADDWNEEVVSHELMHAIIHRLRVLSPSAAEVMAQEDTGLQRFAMGSAEEEVCYEFGRWFDRLWRWLWQQNPHGVHAKPL